MPARGRRCFLRSPVEARIARRADAGRRRASPGKERGGDNENTVALASPAAALGRWVPSLFNPFLLLLYQRSRREVKRAERMEGSSCPRGALVKGCDCV